jgi:hypothetical protein
MGARGRTEAGSFASIISVGSSVRLRDVREYPSAKDPRPHLGGQLQLTRASPGAQPAPESSDTSAQLRNAVLAGRTCCAPQSAGTNGRQYTLHDCSTWPPARGGRVMQRTLVRQRRRHLVAGGHSTDDLDQRHHRHRVHEVHAHLPRRQRGVVRSGQDQDQFRAKTNFMARVRPQSG